MSSLLASTFVFLLVSLPTDAANSQNIAVCENEGQGKCTDEEAGYDESAMLQVSKMESKNEKSSGTLFFLKHTFRNPDVDSGVYWAAAAALDYTQWYADMHADGFHFHSFFPIDAKGPFYCVWEGAPGKTKADMKNFAKNSDGSLTRNMRNKVMLIPGAVLGGHQPVTPYYGSGFAALTQSSESHSKAAKSGSTLYVVKHTFNNPGPDSQAYWQDIAALNWNQWYIDQVADGFYNHMFLPTDAQGPFYCIWEAAPGKTKRDMKNWLKDDDTSLVKKTGTKNRVKQVEKALLYGHQPVTPYNFS